MVVRDSLLRAYVAENSQLLLVLSTHVFFLSGCVVETREFSGTGQARRDQKLLSGRRMRNQRSELDLTQAGPRLRQLALPAHLARHLAGRSGRRSKVGAGAD